MASYPLRVQALPWPTKFYRICPNTLLCSLLSNLGSDYSPLCSPLAAVPPCCCQAMPSAFLLQDLHLVPSTWQTPHFYLACYEDLGIFRYPKVLEELSLHTPQKTDARAILTIFWILHCKCLQSHFIQRISNWHFAYQGPPLICFIKKGLPGILFGNKINTHTVNTCYNMDKPLCEVKKPARRTYMIPCFHKRQDYRDRKQFGGCLGLGMHTVIMSVRKL